MAPLSDGDVMWQAFDTSLGSQIPTTVGRSWKMALFIPVASPKLAPRLLLSALPGFLL